MKYKYRENDEEKFNYWLSIGDLMSGTLEGVKSFL